MAGGIAGNCRGRRATPKAASTFDVTAQFRLDYPGIDAVKLLHRAVILDQKGQRPPAIFTLLPNIRVLLKAAAADYRNLDGRCPNDIIVK